MSVQLIGCSNAMDSCGVSKGAMGFYQVTLNGKLEGIDVINVLWYRETNPIPSGAEFLSYSQAIAAEVRDNVWENGGLPGISGVSLRNALYSGYRLETITVMIHDDFGSPLSTTPYELVVGADALKGGESNGAATTVIMNATLEPAFGPGIGLPKRGHIKLGCIADGDIDGTGRLRAEALEDFTEVGQRLAANLVTEAPIGLFYPVRVRVTRVAGLITNITYRDVSAFAPNPIVSWTRSRKLTG